MKKRLFVAVALALVFALACAIPALAKGGNGESFGYRFKGKTAFAAFSSEENGTCTNVYVSAVDSAKPLDDPEAGGARSAAFIDIFRYAGACAEEPVEGPFGEPEPLMSAYGTVALEEDAFVIAKELDTATLSAEIPVQEFDPCEEVCAQGVQAERAVSVDLVWTGVDELVRINERYSYHVPGFSDKYRAKGFSRFSEASGTISEAELAEEYVAPGDTSDFAELQSVRERYKSKGQPPEEPGFPGEEGP